MNEIKPHAYELLLRLVINTLTYNQEHILVVLILDVLTKRQCYTIDVSHTVTVVVVYQGTLNHKR